MIKDLTASLSERFNAVDIDISNLPSGVYWVKIIQAQYYNATKRFIKVND